MMILPLTAIQNLQCSDYVPPQYDKTAVIALCDFTTSIDSVKAKEDLKKNVESLLDQLQPNTNYSFYALEDNVSRPFIEDSTGENRNENAIKFGDHIGLLKKLSSQIPPNKTCIFQALEICSDRLRNTSKTGRFKKIYLVIFSDMLEACKFRDTTFNFEIGNLKNMIPILNEEPFTNDIFSDIANLKIILAMSTNPEIEFDYSTLEEIWRLYFKNKGFPKKIDIDANFKNTIY